MRSYTYKNPGYKDRSLPTKEKEDSNPLDYIDSQEDYCDLSVSIISDDTPYDVNLHKASIVKSVKQSLAELKNEANLYLHSGDKAIQETNKKLRESGISAESAGIDQESLNILKELKMSVRSLHERLEKNEEKYLIKRTENLELKEIVNNLENKFKGNIIFDTEKKSSNCFCF